MSASQIRWLNSLALCPLLIWATAGLAAVASAQSVVPPSDGPAPSAIANVLEGDGPQDLAGQKKGDRARKIPADVSVPPIKPEPTPPGEREWFGARPIWEWTRLTGDWGGARTYLNDHGISINGSYLLDWSSVWDGGAHNRASTRSLVDINANFNLEKLVGWKGGTAYADFMSSDMRGGSRDAGDLQGSDNIETGNNADQLSELWIEQKLFDDSLRLKFGKMHAQTEFEFVTASSDNIHAAAGALNTIAAMPVYPDQATGLVAFVYPTEHLHVGGGVFDGALAEGFHTGRSGPATFFTDDRAASWFWIGEVGVTWGSVASLGVGRVSVGAWHHTATFDAWDGKRHDGTSGLYAMGEQQLWSPGTGESAATHGLFGWVQYGHADDEVAAIADQFGAGLKLVGTLPTRDDDTAGLFFSYADLTDKPEAGFMRDESALELFYTLQLTPAVKIRPDLQLIFNPSGDSSLDTAVIGGVRLQIAF